MELLAKPGVGGIIEHTLNGVNYILLQKRYKDDAPLESGMIEIPAGKIREFENIFDCLRREVFEETGLEVIEIEGEYESILVEMNGYKVVNYQPFACSQNIMGEYPIMVQTFICRVQGKIISQSNETKNVRWVSLDTLKEMLLNQEDRFYPMHITTLRKYITYMELRSKRDS
ncbi:NTP pyrophosphohydrolase [Desulfosporosinus acidiphilus SJ4]|uniref:NTP pyrophosphohydrolase n=1 Tax=Desulfosporosinus acidiphilus (strain DSM 22704 / JCM 16185 / SJ4) TaxID=646529 RepID=I4D0E5_DESAJ|nr:NUDIX domain-containing protein [Desulfosporosinus acidiphilus]AFM39269.1 NTP pyrophosphohydrolase [Desulfosporosinus acidiphilus SJ4]